MDEKASGSSVGRHGTSCMNIHKASIIAVKSVLGRTLTHVHQHANKTCAFKQFEIHAETDQGLHY